MAYSTALLSAYTVAEATNLIMQSVHMRGGKAHMYGADTVSRTLKIKFPLQGRHSTSESLHEATVVLKDIRSEPFINESYESGSYISIESEYAAGGDDIREFFKEFLRPL